MQDLVCKLPDLALEASENTLIWKRFKNDFEQEEK